MTLNLLVHWKFRQTLKLVYCELKKKKNISKCYVLMALNKQEIKLTR